MRLAFTERSLAGGGTWVRLDNRDGSGSSRLLAGFEPDWRPRP
jgi:hypothetical protein